MGYDTDFIGSFDIDKPLDKETQKILKGLNQTRHMKRDTIKLAKRLEITTNECIEKYGEEGEYYFIHDKKYDDTAHYDIIDYNNPPSSQPGLWCKWYYNEDENIIEWDGCEKFYEYIDWIKYIIENILEPKDYKLNGCVSWRGEEFDDIGKILIKNNEVFINDRSIY